ncbi:hypothetical protein GCM10023143_12020 [Compostibacter hankyongensis]|uniref:Alpha-galactosidase n=2 Tax=Compostibacter hankyongensis TaxID=1007089 RepID=A0ABP8FKY3_9BACT
MAILKKDTLTINNSRIEEKWIWNNGNIIPYSIKNITNGKTLVTKASSLPFVLPNESFRRNEDFSVINKQRDSVNGIPSHLEVTIINRYTNIDVKQEYWIFPGIPAISQNIYWKYHIHNHQSKTTADSSEKNAENKPYSLHYGIKGKNWSMSVVQFRDQTDHHDNLIKEEEFIPYTAREHYTGNLLLANNLDDGMSFFILKEAPNANSQVNYPGYDYTVSNTAITIPCAGFEETSIAGNWIKGYTITTGIGNSKTGNLLSLRQYLQNSILYDPSRYEMIMSNTWGDRGQDGKISESFILKELKSAKKLGITHLQIDDGWQQGLSQNSASKAGSLWDAWTPDNWLPNKDRFPNGLNKVIQSAKENNIKLGLWFNPSSKNNYANWERDADILINLYKTDSIQYFKIDGVIIPNKEAEINFERFLKKVKEKTGGRVFFNLDLTAGIRGGYFMFRNAGNLFLENRYSDFGNYIPFHTLRNLWMLSKYFPPQMLQVEFLNKWRNENKYSPGNRFSPIHYRFEYLFAIAMMAQPLAWMETSNLPQEAFDCAPLIKQYKNVMADIHAGMIMPIGNCPDGISWTGFQSIKDNGGYLLIFRESGNRSKEVFNLYQTHGRKLAFEKVLGNTQTSICRFIDNGKIEITLPDKNSFVMYKYEVQ